MVGEGHKNDMSKTRSTAAKMVQATTMGSDPHCRNWFGGADRIRSLSSRPHLKCAFQDVAVFEDTESRILSVVNRKYILFV